ncbi:MAG: DNA primase [Candidatus Krumholzibacteriota bacterium]|nr:DNA primase [Candidatus Krumholzibacteriota bacterium]
MIPESVINDIRERSDIVHVVGAVLDLKRAGRNYKALCPFHGEKTPSFMVSPDKQIYHCFGCGKGGNVFSFLMEYEGIGFVEAVKKLGEELGVDIGAFVGRDGGEAGGRLDPYYGAMTFAENFFRSSLGAPAATEAREYLDRRGLDRETIEEFGIGFAPPGWENLYREASGAGLDRDVLLELNLVMKSRGGSGYRDYFRNRVIFPIRTLSKRTVGFAGRVLDGSEPKYLNSTESPLYSKGRLLYGLAHGKDDIRKSKSAIIVEGYLDFLTLWMKGIRNVAAVCGTALTVDQSRLLARYAKRVYIVNDGDRAGIRAAVRAADQLTMIGMDTRIVVLPDGEDPDSYVGKEGADALRELMGAAPDYFQFLKEEAERGARPGDRRSQVVKHLLETVSRTEDRIRKEFYLQEIGELFDVPVETLRAGLPKAARRKAGDGTRAPAAERESPRLGFQKNLFRLGLERGEFARRIVETLYESDLEGEAYRKYFKSLDAALKNNIDITGSAFPGTIEDPDLARLASEIALMELPPGPVGKMLDDTLLWLRKAALRDEMRLMKRRLDELAGEPGDDAGREQLQIAEAYRTVAKELGKLGSREESRTDGSR